MSYWLIKDGPKPRFEVNDITRGARVLKYLGWGFRNPNTGKMYTKEQHWYEVRCPCGERAIKSQQQLRDIRRGEITCSACHRRAFPPNANGQSKKASNPDYSLWKQVASQ